MSSLNLPDYRDILESIQDGLVVVDRELRYLYINKKAEQLIAIPKKRLLGKKFTDAFPDHNLNIASLLKKVNEAWSKEKVATLEICFNPNKRWYYLTVYPLKDKYSIIFRDITHEKHLREELQNSKGELDLIFKNVSDGIVIQDTTGKIIYANDTAAHISGYANGEEMVLAPKYALTKQYDIFDQQKNKVPWSESPGGQVLRGKKKSVEEILCFVSKKSKEEVWVDMKTALISSNITHETCAISIFHDITVLKKLEQQKDNFISLVSHELKTPLTSIKVYLQVLQKESEKYSDPTLSKIITKINLNTDTLVELIRSLLDVSRIQEGKLMLHKQPFSLLSLLHKVIDDIQPITNHPIIIQTKKDTELYADRDRISQVFVNLLTNAMKYSDETKDIIINSSRQKDTIIVSIKDFTNQAIMQHIQVLD